MPKLTVDGKEIEVPAGTNLIEAARRLGIEVPHYCYHPGLPIAGACRLCMVDLEKAPRPHDRLQHAGGRRHGGDDPDPARARAPALGHGVAPRQPPARLPGVRSGGRVLAPDLLHAARALRAPDDRRQGPQAQGGADRAARHAGRRAVHPLLALRPLLRHDHEDGRARDLQPGRPLGARAVPGHLARQRVLRQRRRHLPGGGPDRPRLPLPGPRLVPRPREVGLPGVRPRVQRRGPHQHEARPPRPGPAGGAPQAALQPRREPVVDLRRGPLRLRRRRRADPARAPGAARGRDRARPHLGGGRGRGGGRSPGRGPRRHRRPLLLPDVERGPLARPAALRGHARRRPCGLPRAARGRPAPRTTSCAWPTRAPNSRGAELLGCGRAGAADGGTSSRPRGRAGSGSSGCSTTTSSTRAGPGRRWRRRSRGSRAWSSRARTPTGPSARAHVVLPSAAWVEREGTWTNVDGPGPAVLARRAAARGGAAGLGDPGGGRPRRRPGLAAAPGGDTSSATWRRRRPPSRR